MKIYSECIRTKRGVSGNMSCYKDVNELSEDYNDSEVTDCFDSSF